MKQSRVLVCGVRVKVSSRTDSSELAELEPKMYALDDSDSLASTVSFIGCCNTQNKIHNNRTVTSVYYRAKLTSAFTWRKCEFRLVSSLKPGYQKPDARSPSTKKKPGTTFPLDSFRLHMSYNHCSLATQDRLKTQKHNPARG